MDPGDSHNIRVNSSIVLDQHSILSTLSCSYVCSGRNSLGSAEKRVTIHVVGKMDRILHVATAKDIMLSELSSVQPY